MRGRTRALTACVTLFTASAFGGAPAAAREAGANLFRELDLPSLQAARQAVQAALEHRETGEPERWIVPGVADGAVTPLRTWRTLGGRWCREYEERLRLASGETQSATSVRCRATDGLWRSTGG